MKKGQEINTNPNHIDEKSLLALIDQSPISTQLFDPSGNTIKVNKAWEKLWGLKLENLKNYNVLKDKQLVQLGVMQYITKAFKGQPSEIPAVRYLPPKTIKESTVPYRLVKAFIYPIVDQGHIKMVVLMHDDISDEEHAEEELRRYQERLELAQLAGDIGIFEWDITKKEVWFSELASRLYGLEQYPRILRQRDWLMVIHPEDRNHVWHEITESIRNKTDFEAEYRVTPPNKPVRWLRAKGHAYFDNKDTPIRMVGINFDITRRKQLEESLNFKADVTRILSSSLNYKLTFEKVANLAVNTVADWCEIDMLTPEGEIEMVALAHKDPKKVQWAREYRKKNKPDLLEDNALTQVLRTGRTQYFPLITDSQLQTKTKTKKQLSMARKIGITSMLVVPLKVNKKPIGAITFIASESKRQYIEQELQIAEQLASRASLAIENARLYSAVRTQQKRLESLLETVPAIVWESWGRPDQAHHKTDFVSAHVERLLGYSPKQWLSTSNFWLSIVHPEDRERAAKEAADIYESGEGGISRFRLIAKNGRVVWVEAQSYVMKDEQGKPVGMRGVTLDITEQMQQVERKDEFISMASHELKTPVTSIKAFAQISEQLLAKNNLVKANEYLGKMDSQIDKLTNLIADLLDVTRIQQGKLQFAKESFNFDDFIVESIDNLRATVKSHKIKIVGRTKKTVIADKDRIGQVVTNLITNAVKYSPRSKEVIVRLKSSPKEVIVGIQDYGVGIAKKHQDKLFQRFYRVYESDESRFPGLGIGLYISHQLISQHGGKMWLKSKFGEGSTFYFSLPL